MTEAAASEADRVDFANSPFTFHVMKKEDIDDCVDFCANAFHAGEPITSEFGCGWTLDDWVKFSLLFVPRMAEEGNTIIVRNEKGEIVSGMLSEDFSAPVPEGAEEFIESAEGAGTPVFEILDELEHYLIDHLSLDPAAKEDLTLVPKGLVFRLWLIGTHVEYRRQGLGSQVAKAVLDRARSRGFKYAFAQCTGPFSQKIFPRHGKVIHWLDYATWQGSDGKKSYADVPENCDVKSLQLVLVEL